VKSVFSSVATFFHDTFQKAWAGIVKVFSVAGNIFVNIKNGIVTAFKSVVNGLIRGINNVVAVPFRAINTALNTIKNISILGLSPFSNLRTISVPSIPLLASGGVVDAGQLFVAREAGPELVANAGRKTAVMNNDQIVESVSQGVYRAFIQALVQANLYHYSGPQDAFPGEWVLPGSDAVVIRTPGLAGSTTIVATFGDNLVYGTDMEGNNEAIDLWWSQDNRTFRYEVKWNSGIAYRFPSQITVGTV
jgi:hypothetical protein